MLTGFPKPGVNGWRSCQITTLNPGQIYAMKMCWMQKGVVKYISGITSATGIRILKNAKRLTRVRSAWTYAVHVAHIDLPWRHTNRCSN